ncbi:hypothetical protein AVEN_77115-1 [Araneus ventricosus]|uniref:Uncharacterized protein n=1 Tax=Araneus ventricosus TaxID=182803 RepID=A0A4Y2QL67_ARAVE|nr:hypothetical protein AVEN_77115-1 [Araneus ventricosus]
MIVNTDLDYVKKNLRDTTRNLIETTKEVRAHIDKSRPSFSVVLQAMPAPPTVLPIVGYRDSHVVLLRPNKTSSSEENKKIIENVFVKHNSATVISKIAKVNQGGLLIETLADADLQA